MRFFLILTIILLIGCEKENLQTQPESISPTQIVGELMIGTKENGIKLGWCAAGQKPQITMYKDGEERIQITSDFIHFKKNGRMIMEIRPEELKHGLTQKTKRNHGTNCSSVP